MFSKYELLFLNQTNSSSNLSTTHHTQNVPTSLTISVKFYLGQLKPSPTQTSSCSLSVSIFCPTPIWPRATTSIGYTKSYIKPSQSNLLSNYIQIVDTLWVKHATHQNDESLRTASPSNLGDIVNNSSNFSTKYAEFSTKW